MKSFTIAMIAATASSRWVTQSWCYKAGQFPDADGWWQNSDGKWIEDGKGLDRNTKGVWMEDVVDGNCGYHYIADQKSWEMNGMDYAKMMAENKMRDAVDDAMDIRRDLESIDVEYMLADAMRQLRCLWAGFEPVDEGMCQTEMDMARKICEDRGMFYGEAWNYCMVKGSEKYNAYMDWQNNSEKKSMRQRIDVAKKAMVKYEVGISDGELQEIVAESVQLQQEGQQMAGEALEKLRELGETEGRKLNDHARRQQAADEMAAMQMKEYLLTHIKVDGNSLMDIFADQNKLVMMKEMPHVDDMTIVWDGPSAEEMQKEFETKWQPLLEEIADLAEKSADIIGEEAYWTAEDIADYAEERAEIFGEVVEDELSGEKDEAHPIAVKVEELVMTMGSWAKSQYENVDVQQMALAQAAEEESSYSSAATGFGAGIVGVLAGCAVYAVLNKKRDIIAAQQPLL